MSTADGTAATIAAATAGTYTFVVNYQENGEEKRLLDEIDYISSVSGGSFTAAYYGLHGDGIFDDFRKDFLEADVQKHLVMGLVNPTHWFGHKGRTERAIEYYQKILFHDATFADMMQPERLAHLLQERVLDLRGIKARSV